MLNAKFKVGETETALFAAGCFWGVEETFRALSGVIETQVGYTGGQTADPTYEQVCTDLTGHAETVKVVFDPDKISYEKLLKVFFDSHNPTTLNSQGPDFGSQYRSAIYCTTDSQQKAARLAVSELKDSGKWKRPIVTQIEPAGKFFPAEEYHQKYLMKRGLEACHL